MEGLIPFLYRAVVGNRHHDTFKNSELSTEYHKHYKRLSEEQDSQELLPHSKSLHRRAISCFAAPSTRDDQADPSTVRRSNSFSHHSCKDPH